MAKGDYSPREAKKPKKSDRKTPQSAPPLVRPEVEVIKRKKGR